MAADAIGDVLGLGDRGGDGSIELELAADGRFRHECLSLLAGVAHLVHILALAAAKRRVAQERDLRIDAEDLGALDRFLADLNQLVLAGLDIDGAVGHGKHLVLAGSGGADHNEAGRNDLVAGLGLDELQRGTHGVRRGIGRAAEQAVRLAHLNEHGAEVVALLQRRAALIGRHLALAQLDHLLDHGVHVVVSLGIDDLRAADIEADLFRRLRDRIGIADQNRLKEVTGQQARAGLEDAGVGTLGEDDGLGVFLQRIDQFSKHNVSS